MTTAAVSEADILFSPFQLGDLRLPNRIVMAPLTRSRATKETLAPNDLNAEYYRQRASAGLIITEATQITQEGQGYIWTPGIYSAAQVEGWKKVTDAVHAEGGLIFIQLWHVGRVSHVSLQPGGGAPVAPSAIAAKTQTFLASGRADVSPPRALRLDEIPRIVAEYKKAAENAKRAGFDGVEIHRRQWLSDRPVPQRRNQQAHQLIWRPGREPHPFRAGGGRRGAGRLGQTPRRHQAVAGEPGQ